MELRVQEVLEEVVILEEFGVDNAGRPGTSRKAVRCRSRSTPNSIVDPTRIRIQEQNWSCRSEQAKYEAMDVRRMASGA